MAKGVYRPSLLPPRGRQLERSYRPWLTCFSVSFAITTLICIVFGLTAYNIFVHRFGRTEHHYHGGDEVALSNAGKDLSSIFCSAYQVRPHGIADLYLLPAKAMLDPAHHFNRSFTIKALMKRPTFFTRVYYLNQNAAVHLVACRNSSNELQSRIDDTAEFLVIMGDDHYQEWTSNFNARHARYRVTIPVNATCDSNSHLPQLDVVVQDADNYYFVLYVSHHEPKLNHSPNDEKDFTTLTGKIIEEGLDVTGYLNLCHWNQSECDFPLPWNSQRDVVGKLRQDMSDVELSLTFSTDCQERLAFWIPLFGILPAVLVSLTSVWCWCLLVKRRSIRSHYHLVNSESSVVSSGYGSTSTRDESSPPLVQVSSSTSAQEDELCGASIQDYPMEDD